MTQIARNEVVLDRTPRRIESGHKRVYQVVDRNDLFTHGIYENLEDAKAAARVVLEVEPNYTSAQVNVIPLNTAGCYSECMDAVYVVQRK